jgi:hypothetical protein
MADSVLTRAERIFLSEYGNVQFISVDEIAIPVLSLRRIVESKRAAGRDKDRSLLHSLEDALALLEDREKG